MLNKAILDVVLTNERERLDHDRKLRALALEEQEAKTEKAKLELETQLVIKRIADQHDVSTKLPPILKD